MKSCRKRKPRDVQFPRVQFEKARCSGSGGFAAIALSISEIGLRTNGKARFGRDLAVARRPLDGRTPRRPPAICYVRSTCAPCEGGAFERVQAPPGQQLQPEATGAVMEVTKWLKPSV